MKKHPSFDHAKRIFACCLLTLAFMLLNSGGKHFPFHPAGATAVFNASPGTCVTQTERVALLQQHAAFVGAYQSNACIHSIFQGNDFRIRQLRDLLLPVDDQFCNRISGILLTIDSMQAAIDTNCGANAADVTAELQALRALVVAAI